MNADSEFELIRPKLRRLKQCDWRRRVFGAKAHKYVLDPPKPESEVTEFENRYGIKLPSDYRQFITTVGNGGAGPGYGLERLEDGIYSSLEYREERGYIDPSKPFTLTEPWNMQYDGNVNGDGSIDDWDRYNKFEDEYFDDKWVNGLLRICNKGCRIYVNLVVNGSEYGNLWVDDRGSDYGICPLGRKKRIQFLQWYTGWLNRAVKNFPIPKWMFWYKDDL